MTDTIGWGDVDAPSRRLPRIRLNRRRRIALTLVAALVAGGIAGWPPFTSWRADAAAAQLRLIWDRSQGLDNTRVLLLSGVQQKAGILDGPSFARAVSDIDGEEATALDRLVRQAKSMRTWTADVGKARAAVVRAMAVQANALRVQAKRTGSITVTLPILTSIDDQSVVDAEAASTRMDALRKKHHLKAFIPTTEHFHSASTILAQLNRPTDQLLHLQLIATGSDGVTVTDLDTGRVTVRRSLDTTDPESWQPERLFGHSLVGNAGGGTLIIPLSPRGRERYIDATGVTSSSGSPMWLNGIGYPTLRALDESGRWVGPALPFPTDVAPTGMGTGSLLLATNPGGSIDGAVAIIDYYLLHPGSSRRTKLAVTGCPELPAFNGGLVVIPTGDPCDFSSEVELFDLSGRLVRTVKVPAAEVTNTEPVAAPGGTHVAFVTAAAPADVDVQMPTTVRILDTATGSWTTIAHSNSWQPLDWSSDGTTLLLQQVDNGSFNPTQQFGPLAYLRVGDHTLHSIRVSADLANYLS